jgi:hypothetical protein
MIMVDWSRLGAGFASGGLSELYYGTKGNETLWGGLGKTPSPGNATYGRPGSGSGSGGGTGQWWDPRAQGPGTPSDRDWMDQQIRSGLAGVQGREAPQAGGTRVQGATIATGPQDQMRQGQMDLLNRLGGIASGQQQGAGELAAQRQTGRAAGMQQGAARMARGGANAAIAGRQAMNNTAAIGLAGAGQAQQAALQDQTNANQLMGQVLGQGRGQDIGLAQGQASLDQQKFAQQAGLDQSTSLANMQAKLQMMGMNDQAALAWMAQYLGMNDAEMRARLAQEGAAMGQKGIGPDLLIAGGQLAAKAASDRRLKKEISDADDEVDEMLDSLRPQAYSYRDEKWGKGRRVGIMAQDLERSAAGKRIVEDTPEGKLLDVNKALSACLAGVARVNARLRSMEGRR